MRSRARLLSPLVPVLVPALTLICSVTYVSAQSMPPSGSFGFLVNASYVNPSRGNGWAMLGAMNFDGAAKLEVRLREVLAEAAQGVGLLPGLSGAVSCADRPGR